MPKQEIKKMTGIFAAVFAHTGHISKEDAKEISGLDDNSFEEAYQKASTAADKIMKAGGKKMETFIAHYAETIDKHMKAIDPGFY
jgi:hypothetical protein